MLGERLKTLRQFHQLSQYDLAEILHISRSTYGMYELGKRQIPYDTLILLADYYQVSLDYLFGRTEVRELSLVLSETERQFLRQFRAIDQRGQDMISILLRYEYSRAVKGPHTSSK